MTVDPNRAPLDLLAPLRGQIASGVRAALGADQSSLEHYRHPLGDKGLFGPSSMAWEVHSDLPAMLIGGLSALMFQTMHPLAIAGVVEHSNFRTDPLGRLRRTAEFVGGTTFGPTELAEQLISQVRSVHDRVIGTTGNGRPYSANDPNLLRFVHVTEVDSFLRSYQRYGPRPLLRGEKDRYFAEVAEIALRLGADEVPSSLVAVRAYLREVRAELALSEEATETVAFLLKGSSRAPRDLLVHRIVCGAAIELLPADIRRQLGLRTSSPLFNTPRVLGLSFATALRWAIGPPLLRAIARERVAGQELLSVDKAMQTGSSWRSVQSSARTRAARPGSSFDAG